MTSFSLDPIFASPLALILIVIVVLAVPWLVPVASQGLTLTQRRWLNGLRTAAGLLLLLAIFRPSIIRTDSLPTEATLVVLLDGSRSMTLPADEKESRAATQARVFQQLRPEIEKLDESLVLKTLVYSADAREIVSNETLDETLNTPPTGNATDISAALNAAVQSALGKPLAGVVMIGDGVDVSPASAQRGVNDMVRDPQAGARLLASLDVPLWSVAIGPPGDVDQVRDVEVAELAESFSLFAGNEADVEFVVRSRALTGKAVTLRVLMTPEGEGAAPVEVAVRTLTPTGPEDTASMSIPMTAPAAGSYRLEVRADAQEGETLLSNNSQVAFVDVREGGGRVLYLEGQPRPEQAFILRSLRRFPDLQVTYRWIAGDTKERWPIDVGLGESANEFDVVIIGDLPAAAIGDEQWKEIAKQVGDGASLLMIGGVETFAKGGYARSPLANVLPVKLDSREGDLEGDVPMKLSQNHPITTLASSSDAEDQAAAWASLPPLVGASRLSDVRVVPGVEVLLETEAGDPLLVVGEYGGGRVAAFAGDSTWRWWRQGKSLEHRRFWRQMVLWLLNRDSDASDAIDISLSSRRVEVGQSIDYVITYPSQAGTETAVLNVSAVNAAGEETKLVPAVTVPSAEGENARWEGKLEELPPGMYRLRAAYEGSSENAEKTFQVLDQEAELRQPFADHTYLSQLSAQTASSGGQMFLPNQVDELANLITQLRRNSEAPVVQKHRLGDTALSAWPLFIALSTLLSIEWYLRRRWGLA
jgi:uncharacterized membrane protein